MSSMLKICAVVSLVTAVSAYGTLSEAVYLGPSTVAAFDRFVDLTETRIDQESNDHAVFLWVDRQPDARRREIYAQLERGDIVVSRLETRDRGGAVKIPDGLCHQWVGTA